MSNFSVYRIGRGSDMDIQLNDKSISRIHAELLVTGSGAYYLTDCASTNGSSIWLDGEWISIRQDFIGAMEHISLGSYQTTAQQLIAMVQGGRHHIDEDRNTDQKSTPKGPVERNPGTAEIIKKGE